MFNFLLKKRIKVLVVLFMITVSVVSTVLRYDFITDADAAADFEEVLSQFPDTYREQLTALHEAHPNWNFEPFYVEENWNDVILANQLVLSRNLVPSTMALSGVYMNESGTAKWYPAPTAWKSTEILGSYNWAGNAWVPFDSGTWFQASKEAICYIMDPRNWLTENNIFMFEKLSYDADIQTEDVVAKMLKDSFMDCDYARIYADGSEVELPTEPESTTPGETTPGETTPGETTPGETTPGETTPGETKPGETTPGETKPGETASGETKPGETASGETKPGETVPGETAPGETVPAETAAGTAGSGTAPASQTSRGGSTPAARSSGKPYTYAQVFIMAAKAYGVSPIHLSARIIQEQGKGSYNSATGRYVVNGTLASGVVTDDGGKTFRPVSSKDAGKTVYYNYFNIGAGGSSMQQIINNGGKEAMDAGWTSPYLAIMGGAKKLTNNYINVGQDTLYFQKFNVVYHGSDGKLVAWKQYMQNLLAPVNEGYKTRTGYADAGLLDSDFTFRIPVYKSDFPESTYPDPDPDKKTLNPNYKLKSISVKGTDIFGKQSDFSLTPTFNMDSSSYSIIVPYTISSIDIDAKAIASTSKIKGTGHVDLSVGDNVRKIICTSEYGTSKTYKLTVTRQAGSTLAKMIKPSAGSFKEEFAKDKLKYTMYLDNSVEMLSFSVDTESDIAGLVVRYGDIKAECEGGETGYIEIAEGESTIYFDVYPSKDDRSGATTYSVRLIRHSKTVFNSMNLQINDTYINGFSIGDTVADAKTRFGVENGNGVILNSDKKEKADSDLIATGDYVTVYDANGFLYKQYRLILYGDVNGDGKVNLYDFALIKNKIVKNTGISGIFLIAADVNKNSSDVNLYDFATIKNYIVRGVAIGQVK